MYFSFLYHCQASDTVCISLSCTLAKLIIQLAFLSSVLPSALRASISLFCITTKCMHLYFSFLYNCQDCNILQLVFLFPVSLLTLFGLCFTFLYHYQAYTACISLSVYHYTDFVRPVFHFPVSLPSFVISLFCLSCSCITGKHITRLVSVPFFFFFPVSLFYCITAKFVAGLSLSCITYNTEASSIPP